MRRAACTFVVALLAAACQPSAPPTSPVPAGGITRSPPAPAPAATAQDWRLPGTLDQLTTRPALEARFGKANLRQETVPGAEGMGTVALLVVYPDVPGQRLELVLDADNPDAPIRELRIAGSASRWHDERGVRLGMPLSELVALNGAPIAYYGLAWDYGGTVQDWHGGTLANAVGNPLFRRVTLGVRAGAALDGLPVGDGTFRSDDAAWPAAARELVVVELGISWPGDSQP